MSKKLNIRPDTGVYGTYKRISYQPWTALAEFVDNSTQSFYDHKEKLFETKYYKGLEIEIEYHEDPRWGDEIVIKDNAYGMDFGDFQRAIILDRPPRNTSGRNEFGMGLKTAACWFGNDWIVESTRLGSDVKYTAEIDIDALVKYKNESIDVQEETVNRKEHYTIITIRRLNKKIKGKRIEKKVHELLSSIYRADLRTGDIKIYYNGNLLEYEEVDPYTDEDGNVWKKEIEFSIPHKEDNLLVKGFIAIRIPGNVRNAGFTLLRRGRVIVGGPEKNYRPHEVFGNSNDFEYQRLYGELNMDNWPVTQAKDAFDWSNEDLEAKFIDKLVELSSDFKRKARNLRVREKVKVEDIKEELTKQFEKNEHITDVHVELDTAETTEIKDVTYFVEEQKTEYQDDADVNESAGTGVEIEQNTPINISIKYKGKQYKFRIVLDDQNPKSEWLRLETVNQETYEYILTLNVLHLFFYPFIQKKDFLVVLCRFAAALVIAELESYDIAKDGMVSPSSIRLALGKILEDFTDA